MSDGQELLKPAEGAIEPQPVDMNPMTLLQQAIDSGADPDKLEKLTALVERWRDRQDTERFADSLAGFQKRCPVVKKTRGVSLERGKPPSYHYASLDDIMRQVGPLLAECGLSVSFSASVGEDRLLTATCSVRCGTHTQDSHVTLPVPSDMRVNDTQKMGAALSYAKRYALCSALNIVVGDEDTDGGGLTKTITPDQQAAMQDLCDYVKQDVPKLLAWIQPGLKSLADIPVTRYADAMEMLKRKAAAQDAAKKGGGDANH